MISRTAMRLASALPVLLLGALACGRTAVVGPRPEAAPPPCSSAGRLGQARYPIVSSLAVAGDRLYVTSHEAYLPMRYRTPGAVEQLPRCGGTAALLGPSDEDHPEGLVAGDRSVHWRARDNDATGTNQSVWLRSWPIAGGALVSRELEMQQGQVSGPVLAWGALFWLALRPPAAVLETSAEDSAAVQRHARFDLPAHVNGSGCMRQATCWCARRERLHTPSSRR